MAILSKISILSIAALAYVDAAELLKVAKDVDIIPKSYIVAMKGNVNDLDFQSHTASIASIHHENLAKRGSSSAGGLKFVYNVHNWKGYSGSFDEDTLRQILNDPKVDYVEHDRIVKAFVEPSVGPASLETQKNVPTWGLPRISHKKGGSRDYVYDSKAGEGITIYGVDTGIDATHPDFEGRVTWGGNFVGGGNRDGHGHGTHTSGTFGSKTYGVAKKAKIVAVKVLNERSQGSLGGIMMGINWAVSHAKQNNITNKAVMNLSLGAKGSNSLNAVATNAVQAGIFLSVASGNDNTNAQSYTPASAKGVCAISASSQNDAKASFSNYGSIISLYAPGDKIVSLKPGGSTQVMSGTSMAAPHVAGAAAVLMSVEGLEVSKVCDRLKELGNPVISNPGAGTTNKLLYNDSGDLSLPGRLNAQAEWQVGLAKHSGVYLSSLHTVASGRRRYGTINRSFFSTSGFLRFYSTQVSPEPRADAQGIQESLEVKDQPRGSGLFLGPYQKVQDESACISPYVYTVSLPGKNSITKYIDTLQEWMRLDPVLAEAIKSIAVDMVTISLMLDDIQDGSELRRGFPAAHVVYGPGQTINSTTYIIAKAARKVEQLANNRSRMVFLEEIQNICAGQGLDLYWRHHAKCPSIEEYISMVDNKTGGFFRLVTRLMAAVSKEPMKSRDLLQLVTLMGRYYQIRDDYQNLVSEEYAAKKGFCDDLSEGKFSLPLIHLLQNAPSQAVDRVRDLIFRRDQRAEDSGRDLSLISKRWVLAEMKNVGSLEYVYTVLEHMHAEMFVLLNSVENDIGENKKLRAFLVLLKL
ncbi:hypothetical protein LOZ66_000747 [Ophidiomyces ophidiicola]|nr:hypothetical protein LOZ66_000747 [Ophidiomyces ophidiicola]